VCGRKFVRKIYEPIKEGKLSRIKKEIKDIIYRGKYYKI
jgi:hypothetical protein